jgi:hypothetical protein
MYNQFPELQDRIKGKTEEDIEREWRYGNATAKMTDEEVEKYVDEVMTTYGNGHYLTFEQFAKYFKDVIAPFEPNDLDYSSDSLAREVMHIIDFNRNKRVDKDELKALLHQLTLSN